jgi:thymidylate synthase
MATQQQNTDEQQYLDLVRYVIEKGVIKNDRTGTGTKSVFGATMRFSLRNDTIPLITTKQVFWRGVLHELLWFINGNTNSFSLKEKNVNIWNAHGSRQYLDSINLKDNPEGDLGPVYGFQWRHFGAKYVGLNHDYQGEGIDQLKEVINLIKTDPNSRRILFTAWNPLDLNKMALPPCHVLAQFSVNEGELSCILYQRSADLGLGVPFNIASYSLLTHIIAKCTGLRAGEFIHMIGDAHVYLNHENALLDQLKRVPYQFPTISFNNVYEDIDQYQASDINLVGYKNHGSIIMEMSV